MLPVVLAVISLDPAEPNCGMTTPGAAIVAGTACPPSRGIATPGGGKLMAVIPPGWNVIHTMSLTSNVITSVDRINDITVKYQQSAVPLSGTLHMLHCVFSYKYSEIE